MLKITDIFESRDGCRMELQGRLVGPWVDELQRVVRDAAGHCTRVVLDLSAVSFVDRPGVELLRQLADEGIEFGGVTPYIAESLEPSIRG